MSKTALLFRDPDYGALGVTRGARAPGVVTIDHGFAESDYEAVLELMERYALAKPVDLGDGSDFWNVKVHEEQALVALEGMLRRRGYTDDPLGERAVIRVTEEDAKHPDLPAAGKVSVSEFAERGFHSFVDEVGAALRAKFTETKGAESYFKFATAFFPRPNARGLPFMRARALSEWVGQASEAENVVRATLARAQGAVQRATARFVAPGRILVEFGLALPASVIESFERAALPAFRKAEAGVREVRFKLSRPIEPAALMKIAERGANSGALTGKLDVTGTSELIARVPSSHSGHYVADQAVSERVGWLSAQLAPLGAELEEISELQEGAFGNAVEDAVRAILAMKPGRRTATEFHADLTAEGVPFNVDMRNVRQAALEDPRVKKRLHWRDTSSLELSEGVAN